MAQSKNSKKIRYAPTITNTTAQTVEINDNILVSLKDK
jgi:hypothetical protein